MPNLVHLRDQPDLLACVAQLGRLGPRLARFGPLADVGAARPLLQRHGVNTEVLRDLMDRHCVLTPSRDVVTQFVRVGRWNSNILPGCDRQVRSDATYSFSRPHDLYRPIPTQDRRLQTSATSCVRMSR